MIGPHEAKVVSEKGLFASVQSRYRNSFKFKTTRLNARNA